MPVCSRSCGPESAGWSEPLRTTGPAGADRFTSCGPSWSAACDPVRTPLTCNSSADVDIRSGAGIPVSAPSADRSATAAHCGPTCGPEPSGACGPADRSKGGTKDEPKDRYVPLDEDLATLLREHMREFPPVEVTLPWLEKGGDLVTVRLMFTTRERKALNKNYFNYLWKAALEAIGVIMAVNDKPVGKGRKWEECRDKMMHALRHLFASEAINEGVDVYTLADLLGHEDPAFTLRRYVHRIKGAAEKARKAIGRRHQMAA
nr:tyrosine-type recombinase/integrase [Streptomyces sp. LX-29]